MKLTLSILFLIGLLLALLHHTGKADGGGSGLIMASAFCGYAVPVLLAIAVLFRSARHL